MTTRVETGFTLDALEWTAWAPTVPIDAATPEQLAVLDESNSKARTSQYYLLLVHETEVLRHRSKLFNAVMYGREGLSRAERELASVAESRINGCPYCASVHGRLFAQLTKQPGIIQRIFDEGVDTELAPRHRAIVDYAAKLSRTPAAADARDIAALRAAGITDAEILDITHVVAMFAWANRLMQTLGEPVRPPV